MLIVDDVLSIGGTLRALCDPVDATSAELVDVAVVRHRVGEDVSDLPVEQTALLTVDGADSKIVILEEWQDASVGGRSRH